VEYEVVLISGMHGDFKLPKPSTSASASGTFDPLGFFPQQEELASSSSERREGTSGFNGKFFSEYRN
jgi:hypothetical protein